MTSAFTFYNETFNMLPLPPLQHAQAQAILCMNAFSVICRTADGGRARDTTHSKLRTERLPMVYKEILLFEHFA